MSTSCEIENNSTVSSHTFYQNCIWKKVKLPCQSKPKRPDQGISMFFFQDYKLKLIIYTRIDFALLIPEVNFKIGFLYQSEQQKKS